MLFRLLHRLLLLLLLSPDPSRVSPRFLEAASCLPDRRSPSRGSKSLPKRTSRSRPGSARRSPPRPPLGTYSPLFLANLDRDCLSPLPRCPQRHPLQEVR
eukprot:scaffold846_cov252-Pinguiococcus_pyrenoidosus.AAC.28